MPEHGTPGADSLSGLMLDEQGVRALASELAPKLRPPLVIYLQGDLGAGKTTLARALIQALGHAGRVKSPTYGLLEHYDLARLQVLHLDLYRLADKGELEFLGITDLFDSNTILLVEWPEKGGHFLPPADLEIHLEGSGDSRRLSFLPHSGSGNAVCNWVKTTLSK